MEYDDMVLNGLLYKNYEGKLHREQKVEKRNDTMTKEQLQSTVDKMIKIVRGNTGGSKVYADMLLSMLPNSEHKVSINHWIYKADKDDFEAMLELIKLSKTNLIFDYEEIIKPFIDELEEYTKLYTPNNAKYTS